MSLTENELKELQNNLNHRNDFAGMLGAKVTELTQGYCCVDLAITESYKNPIGSVHGGCLYTIADIAGGVAAKSYGDMVTTVEGSLHFLRPGLDTTHLTATTREVKRGRTILVYDVSVFDQKNVLLAEGIFSYMVLKP